MDNEIASSFADRKLWPFIEADKVVKRYSYDTSRSYVFETGFGPSGFPHIGTFGEVVRTEFIINALKSAGFKTKLIVFSDDLDGLRKVPEDMPEWLKDHLGKPVSSIPDPYGTCASFSDHMNSKLKDMLEWMEIDYVFKSSKSCYENGEFDEEIRILLENYGILEKIIKPTLSEETLQNWHPFFPICEKCGNVLTTVVKSVDIATCTVNYVCSKAHGVIKGCGYEGTQTAFKGHGKMTWRVDWPMRWKALGIDYELYGKDLIESFNIGKRIMNQVFHTKEPENMFYEMFLDENGAKISKSKGKGLTVEEWLKYGTIESLNLLMYHRPRKAKELSFNIIPNYVDEVIEFSTQYHADPDTAEHPYRFITRFRADEKKFPKISYMLICNLMAALKSTESEMIKTYISRQKEFSPADIESAELNEMIEKATRYYHDFISVRKHKVEFSSEDRNILNELIEVLRCEKSADDIHNAVYEIARKNNLQPKDFFKIIYLALIGQDRGPRIGNFAKMIGQDKMIEILSGAVSQ